MNPEEAAKRILADEEGFDHDALRVARGYLELKAENAGLDARVEEVERWNLKLHDFKIENDNLRGMIEAVGYQRTELGWVRSGSSDSELERRMDLEHEVRKARNAQETLGASLAASQERVRKLEEVLKPLAGMAQAFDFVPPEQREDTYISGGQKGVLSVADAFRASDALSSKEKP